ncbi:hypothetical protein E3P92_02291 [Wallemia ichthyophaga]|nr:hypothetical protein E3P92_02291 [Wallemia ichthyophaga]TIB35161.1 hypothetical protein E3P84_01488 [Wallemia ichthyophaga]TIB42065.1 hypothetical protein E3P83_01437 [Wallemia ichthyophaga]
MEGEAVSFKPSAPVHVVLCADCGEYGGMRRCVPHLPQVSPSNQTPPISVLGVCVIRAFSLVNRLLVSYPPRSVDITAEIPKSSSVTFCRGCERYANPPNGWMLADWESRELLAICLKKLKGLSKIRLIDAGFIWTEPHSKRIKVKLTVQKEVLANTILQQVFEVTYTILGAQCPDCTRMAAKNTWQTSIQVRQKVPHKRTFFYLEQLILKHGAHKDCVNILERKDGLDFYYLQRQAALRMLEFLQNVVPIRYKSSEELLTTDVHTGSSKYKFTYSVEIVPVCKDDLVCLPIKLARQFSNISPLVLCARIGNSVHLLDPFTLHTTDVTAPTYWRAPFDTLATVGELTEYIVLDAEPVGPTRGKLVLADLQVMKASGGASDDEIVHTRTHLGHILQAGDTCLGYNIRESNFNSDTFESLNPDRLPDVVVVKKAYPNRRKKNRPRNFKLKSIAKDAEDSNVEGAFGRGALGRRGGVDTDKVEKQYEEFLNDLEEDPEMRAGVNMYRSQEQKDKAEEDMDESDVGEVEVDENLPKMDELMEDLEEMNIEE